MKAIGNAALAVLLVMVAAACATSDVHRKTFESGSEEPIIVGGNDARPAQPKGRDSSPEQEAVSTAQPADGCVSSGCHVRFTSIRQQHFPGQARRCDACHTGSSPDHPGKPGPEFVLGMEKLDDMCFSCHPALVREIVTSTLIHTPVAEGKCDACHDAHGTDFPMLLRDAVRVSEGGSPDGVHYLDITMLCWQCHDRRILEEDEPSADVTRFRNSDWNLHFLHVSKRKKQGCKACHETHAGRQPALMRDTVPFGTGGWKLPVRFTRTPNGGSCVVGCHTPREYDREPTKQRIP